MKKLKWILAVLLMLHLSSCHHGSTSTTVPQEGEGAQEAYVVEVPDEVTEENLSVSIRRLWEAPLGSQGRPELRHLIVAYLMAEADRMLDRGDEEEAWASFERAVRLYEARELHSGGLEPELSQMARRLLEVYEPRGDEARTMICLLVLGLTDREAERWNDRYERVSRWSEEVRGALPSEIERVLGLVRVYEEVAIVVPLPDPVDRLAQLYIERHGLFQGTFNDLMSLQQLFAPQGRQELQQLFSARGQTVADIVHLYVNAGRPDEVRRAVAPLGTLSEQDRELVQATRDLRSSRRRSRGLAFLAANLGRRDPELALRLCHQGRRSYPRDIVFDQCLAEVYRSIGDNDAALDYYEAILDLEPTAANYEQVLQFVVRQMERELQAEDAHRAREIHARAERILRAYRERFPNRRSVIQTHHLEYLIGLGEYNTGNIDRAVEHFEAANAEHPTRLVHLQLGEIAERRGDAQAAIRHYRAALDLTPEGQRGEDPLSRAEVLKHLADAFALAGNAQRARQLYQEALEMLQVAQSQATPRLLPEIEILRGFVLYALGQESDAMVEFRAAQESAPGSQSILARLLSFYVGRALVQPALDVYHVAFNSSEFEHLWKVYFSMWIIGLQRRLGQEPDDTAVSFLATLDGDDWIDRLGRLYAGNISYEELLASARTPGQRAEAYYYQAVLELARGHRDEAVQLLHQVIGTNMLGYYEYQYAQLLLRELGADATSGQGGSANAPAGDSTGDDASASSGPAPTTSARVTR